jgi:hypothetical protein
MLDSTQVFHMAVPVCLPDTSAVRQEGPGQDLTLCLNFESEKGHLCLLAILTNYGLS